MKTLLSLMMGSVLFITHAIGLCEATKNPLPIETTDTRLLLSQHLIERGQYFEHLAEQNPLLADQVFDAMVKSNIDGNLNFTKSYIEAVSEEEAQSQIKAIKALLTDSSPEVVFMILGDRTITARQKLASLMNNMSLENVERSVKHLKDKIKTLGYEKTFSDLATEVRSRSYDRYAKEAFFEKYGMDILAVIVCVAYVGALVYLTLYFTSLEFTPTIAIWAVVFILGAATAGG